MQVAEIIAVIQDVFEGLLAANVIQNGVNVDANTVLLGEGSELDSLGFVTFVTDLEERVCEKLGKDIYFVLSDVQDFNVNNPYLSANTFANYIKELIERS